MRSTRQGHYVTARLDPSPPLHRVGVRTRVGWGAVRARVSERAPRATGRSKMAAIATDSVRQGSPQPSTRDETPLKMEAQEEKGGLRDTERGSGDSEAVKMEGDVEKDSEGRDDRALVAPDAGEVVAAVRAMGAGDDDEEEEEEEMVCELTGAGESPEQQSPASCSDAGDGTEKEPKREQRDESESSPGDRVKGKGDDTAGKSAGGGSHRAGGDKRRASVEMSSSDGEPLSRMDSEDSTLMDMDSTASSGRSTPAMMNGQGGTAPSSTKGVAYACCWDRCPACFSSSPDLAEHIRGVHVDGQRGGVFVCLWKGCKVYNTPSTSQSWLQRHMLTHSGDKPFKCVVGGCNASFASQGGLARHVPTHFSQQNSSKVSSQPKGKEESPSKAGINKRKKLRNKRRRSLPRPHDFFDAQTMDAIRHRAICLNLATHIESLGSGHSVVFHSTVIARRKEDSGKVKVLLHWTPEDILPDVWVSETDRPQLKTKVVHLSQLPHDTAVLLDPNIYRTLPQKRLNRRMFF
ncbi:zinc finger protein AEBP2 isoform X2 [Paramormyrops kingsleyae]|uniref:zinc finger protein AEBP2 isoform X2 n=1 Tax=Paramormyrops kingsleyae TaxID=1676925 RepID=UPI003B977418